MEYNNTLAIGLNLQGKSHTYTIEKVLGQGSFGITYLATTHVTVSGALGEIETVIQVAIKEFFMRDINGREENTVTSGSQVGLYANYKRKFIREVENLSKLHHPHIVKVLEYFEANNTVYYAMEYMEGGSLDDYIKQKNGLPEVEAVKYAKQIGVALSYMHANKMLHLDLKPGNVMLRKNGDAVLIDFGLSKQYDEEGKPETSTSVGGGTPGYAPLEQANYHDGKDFPVTMDVYALGATLFKMLTGVCPPEASDILNDGFPAYELQKHQVGDGLITCVAQAMASLKKDRMQSVTVFLDALEGKGMPSVNDIGPDEVVVENYHERDATRIGSASIVKKNSLWNVYYWFFSPLLLYLHVSPEDRPQVARSLWLHPILILLCLWGVKVIGFLDASTVEILILFYSLITSIVGILLFIPATLPFANRLLIPSRKLWMLIVLFILSLGVSFGVYQTSFFIFSAVIMIAQKIGSWKWSEDKLGQVVRTSFSVVYGLSVLGAFLTLLLIILGVLLSGS